MKRAAHVKRAAHAKPAAHVKRAADLLSSRAMRAWRQDLARWAEWALVAAATAWTLWFLRLQTYGLTNPHFLEWDARAHTLSAWRYHGTGLFPHDLLVDFAAVYYPPGVKLVYWLGTFFANPHWLCKFVPFALGEA